MALVIEKVSVRPLHHSLQERIFDPLDLEHTKMQNSTSFANSAASYAVQDDRTPLRVASPTIGAIVFPEGSGWLGRPLDY